MEGAEGGKGERGAGVDDVGQAVAQILGEIQKSATSCSHIRWGGPGLTSHQKASLHHMTAQKTPLSSVPYADLRLAGRAAAQTSVGVRCRETLKQARAELAGARKREQELRRALEQKERRLGDIEASVEDTAKKAADLKTELGTELLAQLSAAERSELGKLAPQLKKLQVCKPRCSA